MPTIGLAVPQSAETVTKRAMLSVTRDIMGFIGLPENTSIVVNESMGAPASKEDTLNKKQRITLSDDNHVVLNYKELFTENGIVTNTFYKKSKPFIFADPDIGLSIYPATAKVEVNMTLRIKVRDRGALEKFRRLLRIRGGINYMLGKHNLKYDFVIPGVMIAFVHDSWSMREHLGGYNETLTDYLHRCIPKGLVKRSNMSGEFSTLAINQQENDIQGHFSEEVFYNDTESSEGSNNVEISYKFFYDEVVGAVMHYPLMIHNQRVSNKYLNSFQTREINPLLGERTLQYLSTFTEAEGLHRFYKSHDGYRVDPFDDWFPKFDNKGSLKSAIITPISIDVTDFNAVLSLHDFSNTQLPPSVKDMILRFPDLSLELYRAPYKVTLYSVNREEREEPIEILPSGEVRTLYPMNIRNRYFLRIGITLDLSKLSTNVVQYLLTKPVDVLNILSLLDGSVVMSDKSLPDAPNSINLKTIGDAVNNNGKITLNSYIQAIKNIKTTNSKYANNRENNPYLIGNINIIAQRRN